jgi:CRISPR-associated protein Csm5
MSKIQITTLTPIHIGNGYEIPAGAGHLYFGKDRKLAILDDQKVLEVIGGIDEIHRWIAKINAPQELLEYLRSRKRNLAAEDISKRILINKSEASVANKSIREHIHSRGQLYLPGSSVKGSFRTVLFQQEVAKDHAINKRVDDQFSSLARSEEIIKDRKGRYTDTRISKLIFGDDPKKDVLRLLHVSDFYFDTPGVLHKTIGLNYHGEDDYAVKESITQFAECIPAKATSVGRINVPAVMANALKARGYFSGKVNAISLQDLFKQAKDYMEVMLNDELNLYSGVELPEGAEGFEDKLNDLFDLNSSLKDGQECIIRLGYGSGYRFMTGGFIDYLKDNQQQELKRQVRHPKYEHFDLPKSRRMKEGGVPLGFIKLSVLK